MQKGKNKEGEPQTIKKIIPTKSVSKNERAKV